MRILLWAVLTLVAPSVDSSETIAVGTEQTHDSSSELTSVGTEHESHESVETTLLGHAHRSMHSDTVVSVGTEIESDGVSFATLVGSYLNASSGADRSVLVGTHLQSHRDGQVVVGAYASPSDAVLVIGAGSPEGTHNAFEVFANGTVLQNHSPMVAMHEFETLQNELYDLRRTVQELLVSQGDSEQCEYNCTTVRQAYRKQCCGMPLDVTSMVL